MPEHAQSKLLQRGGAWKSHSGAKRHHFDPVPYSARACDDVFTHEVSRAFHSARLNQIVSCSVEFVQHDRLLDRQDDRLDCG